MTNSPPADGIADPARRKVLKALARGRGRRRRRHALDRARPARAHASLWQPGAGGLDLLQGAGSLRRGSREALRRQAQGRALSELPARQHQGHADQHAIGNPVDRHGGARVVRRLRQADRRVQHAFHRRFAGSAAGRPRWSVRPEDDGADRAGRLQDHRPLDHGPAPDRQQRAPDPQAGGSRRPEDPRDHEPGVHRDLQGARRQSGRPRCGRDVSRACSRRRWTASTTPPSTSSTSSCSR